MNYWQFKFKEENWDWKNIKIGHIEDWDYPRLTKHKDIAIDDIVFLYRFDASRGIYFIGKIIKIDLDMPQPLYIEITHEFKDKVFRPEDNGYALLVSKINKLNQNGTVYKFLKEDNSEKLYSLLTNDNIRVTADEKEQENTYTIPLNKLIEDEANELYKSMQDSSEARKKRLKSANPYPKKIKVSSYTYKRNADVVVEALLRADGVCERCDSKAPFIRSSNDTPYLEVHHMKPLSKGGRDDLENVLALCPNCHRKDHFG